MVTRSPASPAERRRPPSAGSGAGRGGGGTAASRRHAVSPAAAAPEWSGRRAGAQRTAEPPSRLEAAFPLTGSDRRRGSASRPGPAPPSPSPSRLTTHNCGTARASFAADGTESAPQHGGRDQRQQHNPARPHHRRPPRRRLQARPDRPLRPGDAPGGRPRPARHASREGEACRAEAGRRRGRSVSRCLTPATVGPCTPCPSAAGMTTKLSALPVTVRPARPPRASAGSHLLAWPAGTRVVLFEDPARERRPSAVSLTPSEAASRSRRVAAVALRR